ncbi:hypothetical protein, partial [uncultured Gimesia sp.]|uniref:hypothetical protein n=1 Tax=uncultured Gimesia sp. TaxID=1678688 RepID=UPI002622504C
CPLSEDGGECAKYCEKRVYVGLNCPEIRTGLREDPVYQVTDFEQKTDFKPGREQQNLKILKVTIPIMISI